MGYPAPPGLTSYVRVLLHPSIPGQIQPLAEHSWGLAQAPQALRGAQAPGVLELTGKRMVNDWGAGGSTGPGFGEPGAGLEGAGSAHCPREAATNYPRRRRRGPVSAQVSCKASGCPPFQASCTCMETQPQQETGEVGRRRGLRSPHLCVRVGREEGGRGVQSLGGGEVEKLVVPCPPSRGWRWQAGVETDFSSSLMPVRAQSHARLQTRSVYWVEKLYF